MSLQEGVLYFPRHLEAPALLILMLYTTTTRMTIRHDDPFCPSELLLEPMCKLSMQTIAHRPRSAKVNISLQRPLDEILAPSPCCDARPCVENTIWHTHRLKVLNVRRHAITQMQCQRRDQALQHSPDRHDTD